MGEGRKAGREGGMGRRNGGRDWIVTEGLIPSELHP